MQVPCSNHIKYRYTLFKHIPMDLEPFQLSEILEFMSIPWTVMITAFLILMCIYTLKPYPSCTGLFNDGPAITWRGELS